MISLANYKSVKTAEGMKIFRYDTVFQSEKGPGDVIGLIYMMNPGDARPESDELFNRLLTTEYETEKPVITKADRTMDRAMSLIKKAYKHNNVDMPEQFTIHVENLFNLREKKSDIAKTLAKRSSGIDGLMFRSRALLDKYQFVWLAWGHIDVRLNRQEELLKKYPDAIAVHKLNCRGDLRVVDFPIHPLYMNSDYFLEAAKGRIG